MFNPPDIVYDGIPDPERSERGICIKENEKIIFINLDAANEFKDLSKDVKNFACEDEKTLSLK
jgi:hypothetical protein